MMQSSPPTRHHVHVNGRDVHYRRCGRGPAVVMLHASPRSSAALVRLMQLGPGNVTMLAFDTPGCGDSTPLALHRPEIADYADALADTLTALGIEGAAVYGTHTGAAIATSLARRHPRHVAALVLDGLSLFDPAERAQILESYLPPFTPQVDGIHLTQLWSRVRDQHLFFPWNHRGTGARLWRPLPSAAQLHAGTLDLLRAGPSYRGPYAAAFSYDPRADLDALRMPVFIGARTDDVLLPHLKRLGELPANVCVASLPADTAAWGARVWSVLLKGAAAPPDSPAATDAKLPGDRLGSTFVGTSGARLHVRGKSGGAGRPLVLIHDSPGGARGLDQAALRALHERPVIVPDLPAHGDSDGWHGSNDARSIALALDSALRDLGIAEADIEGAGAGSVIAAACAALRPVCYRAAPATSPGVAAETSPAFEPRADGGHLQAAWLRARDDWVLGPAWSRGHDDRHDFGDDIDVERVHSRCVEALKESPEAAAMRAGLLEEAKRVG